MEENVQQDQMETFIVNVYHLLLGLNVKVVSFDFFFSLILLKMKWNKKKIGGLEIGEQTILMNFYNGLISNGSLNWDLSTDLCGQTGIVCDSSSPKRVIQLYSFFFFFSFFEPFIEDNKQ